MSYGVTVSKSVQAMSSRQLRAYVFHYLDVEEILNVLVSKGFKSVGGICTGCLAIRHDDDCDGYDCVCSFDYSDISCEKWYVIDNYLTYLVQVDIDLRQEFGNNPDVICGDDIA